MKQSFNLLTISLVAPFFAACGDDSNTTPASPTKLSNADMEVDSYGQLPSCAEKREGKTAYVADQEQGYICQNGEWVEDDGSIKAYSSSRQNQLLSSSSLKNSSARSETMTDSRDGQTYKIVTIGDQIWMAENLNYKTDSSYCYNDAEKYCEKYGRLYTWNAAMKACPTGWHLPDTTEYNTLFKEAGYAPIAQKMLKSTDDWDDDKNGIDAFGFSVLPAGGRSYSNELFGNLGKYAFFWNSTEYEGDFAFVRYYYIEDENEPQYPNSKAHAFSVRCLKD